MINEWTAISGELALKDIELTYNLHVQQYFMKPQTGHAINKKGCLIPDENKERRAGGECNREDRKEKALRVKKKKKMERHRSKHKEGRQGEVQNRMHEMIRELYSPSLRKESRT